MIKQFYQSLPGDYYSRQMGNTGVRGTWFRGRQSQISALVRKYFSGGVIVDIGCGNCLWNTGDTPTIGIDICNNMLRYNASRLSRFMPVRADFSKGIPLGSNSVKIVVISEVLEHFQEHRNLIAEIHRILQNDGLVIGSVPYGRFPGLWNIFFPVWCRYRWLKDRDQYYLHQCGHASHFNKAAIHRLFKGFGALENYTYNLLTVFFVFRKQRE